jgi:hypothetical protein
MGSRGVQEGAENLAPNGIRSPGLPARSVSLYRLTYPGPQEFFYNTEPYRTISRANVYGIPQFWNLFPSTGVDVTIYVHMWK